jgi:hypothetical protein
MAYETLVKGIILIILFSLILAIAMAIDTLRRGDQARLANLCQNGIDVPIAKGAIVSSSFLTFPKEDTTFHIDLGC